MKLLLRDVLVSEILELCSTFDAFIGFIGLLFTEMYTDY